MPLTIPTGRVLGEWLARLGQHHLGVGSTMPTVGKHIRLGPSAPPVAPTEIEEPA